MLLAIRDLRKHYPAPGGGRRDVLDVPELDLAEGEQVALAGTSGSGKTTLLHVVAGLVRPDSGSVVLDGADLARLSEPARDRVRAAKLGYVFQTFNLLQGYTALENVLLGMLFGPGRDRAFAESLLERLGLADRRDDRPRQLSVGQQQRVAVARALANRPKLVLADEPTGNLDPGLAAESLGLIRELCAEQGAGLLLVSHDERALSQFDRRLDLAELNHAAQGSPSEAAH